MTTERAELNDLINGLPDETIRTIKEFVIATQKAYEQMKMKAYLAAIPEDDEPVTEADLKAFAEAEEDVKHGRVIPAEQLWKELGL